MYLDFQSDDDVAFLARNVLHRRITVDAFYHDIAIAVPQGIADISLVDGRLFTIFKAGPRTASLCLRIRIGHGSCNKRIDLVGKVMAGFSRGYSSGDRSGGEEGFLEVTFLGAPLILKK